MKYNIFFYFYPSFMTFFTVPDPDFSVSDPEFWPIWNRIRTQKKRSDPDPGKNPDPKH